jgi:hypothetical protein
MSEALTNVEDEAPESQTAAPEQTTDTAAPEQQQVEPQAQPAEVEAVEVGGQKYVPLSALLETRREAKSLKEAASRVQQAEAWIAQAQPYVQFLQANPHLMQQQQTQAPAPAGVDPEIEALARDLDLYTPKGELDVARATKIAQRQERLAQSAAQRIVAPMQQTTAQERANMNFQRALSVKLPDGSSVDQNALRQVFAGMPAELAADPQVATVLLAVAAGASRFSGQPQPAPPARAPLFTEDSGGTVRTKQALTSLDRKVIAARGMTEDAFHKATADFKPGRTNVIEDD